MLDFIEVLSKVSLLFQHNDITLAAAKDGLEVASIGLKAMVARPACKFSEFLNATGMTNHTRALNSEAGLMT